MIRINSIRVRMLRFASGGRQLTVMVACIFVATVASAQTIALEIKDGADRVVCTEGKRTVWSDAIYTEGVVILPKSRRVIYQKLDNSGDNQMIVCRTAAGRICWSSNCISDEIRPNLTFYPSSLRLIVEGSGPTVGAAEWSDPTNYQDIYASRSIARINIATGSTIWESNESKIGAIVWWSNRVLIAVKFDFSKTSLKAAILKRQPFPLTCVAYTQESRYPLWSEPLSKAPGLPKGQTVNNKGQLVLHFTGQDWLAPQGTPYVSKASTMTITVPFVRPTFVEDSPVILKPGDSYRFAK